MRDQQVGAWLDELASAAPAPGGGAAAALSASAGASLIAMVCNLTIGKPRYAAFDDVMTAALARAEQIRQAALDLAEEDARAFDAVIAAYRLPKGTDAEAATRRQAVQQATAGAAEVPLRVAGLAADVIVLAEEILPGANASVLSDVAVAASMARAALDSSMVNVEINFNALDAGEARTKIAQEVRRYHETDALADSVIAEVRQRITP
jgi:formiminotetrahydrofolate cyclodeaminase